MLRNGGGDRLLVVETIADASPHFPGDLPQELGHWRRVLLTAFRHRRREHLTLVIDTEVQFLPALNFFAQFIRICRWLKLIRKERLVPF
jgi:hypothetical protein